MSCVDCEKEDGSRVAYFRWGTANVGLIGCPKHLKEIIDCLNQKEDDKKQSVLLELKKLRNVLWLEDNVRLRQL